ncbi:MAG: serine O-acetyltransferase [Bacillales bacterium]|nr:serine O-acetyltransferase [Bacillales bacterium]
MELKCIEFKELPNKEKINQFVSSIIDLLFPNYFHMVKELDILEKECHFYFHNYISDDIEKELVFFDKLKEIYSSLLCDIEMTYESDPACTCLEEPLISYPGIYAIIIYRIAHILYLLDLKIIARLISEGAHSKTGIDIHPGATIGDYFFIDHGTGIVIGETTVIGHHVKIYQGVTLGALSLGRGQGLKGKKRHPTIGNYVTIYSGASILGGSTSIGDNTIIGSNVFITKSIEENKKIINKEVEVILIDKK